MNSKTKRILLPTLQHVININDSSPAYYVDVKAYYDSLVPKHAFTWKGNSLQLTDVVEKFTKGVWVIKSTTHDQLPVVLQFTSIDSDFLNSIKHCNILHEEYIAFMLHTGDLHNIKTSSRYVQYKEKYYDYLNKRPPKDKVCPFEQYTGETLNFNKEHIKNEELPFTVPVGVYYWFDIKKLGGVILTDKEINDYIDFEAYLLEKFCNSDEVIGVKVFSKKVYT